MQKGRVVSLQYLYFNCSICTISLVVFFFFLVNVVKLQSVCYIIFSLSNSHCFTVNKILTQQIGTVFS